MNTTHLGTWSLIKNAWHTFKTHWGFIWVAGIITIIIEIALHLIQQASQRGSGHVLLDAIAMLFVVLIGLIVSLGWINVLLKMIHGDTLSRRSFTTSPQIWLRAVVATLWVFGFIIVFGILAALPFIILVLIGTATHSMIIINLGIILVVIALATVAIYYTVRYQFTAFVVIEHPELNGKQVFKKAGALTRGHVWQLIGFGVVLGLLNILGFIFIVIGLAFTIPVTKIARAKMYAHLKQNQ